MTYSSTLAAGEYLQTNDSLLSDNGEYKLLMQEDCNLVLYKGSTALWDSDTVRTSQACFLIIQSDGNLVIYLGASPEEQGEAIWNSATQGATAVYFLNLQNDGNLVIYEGTARWSTNTVQA